MTNPVESPDAGSGPGTGGLAPLVTYLREMYPPLPRLVLCGLWFYAIYLSLAAYHGEPVALLTPTPVAGVLTYFFFLLFLRLSDEWKDERADRIHFPERSVPSGQVSMGWIRAMWTASLVVVLLLQGMVGGFQPAFVVLMVYGLLMFRYFFFERRISSSLLLAFVTHNPVGFLLNLYAVSLFTHAAGRPLFQGLHLALALALWLPSPVWEVARKIRAPEEETEYETYSRIFGLRGAVTLASLLAVLFAALGVGVGGVVGLGWIGRAGLVLATAGFVWRCVRFAVRREPGQARLQAPAELWALASLTVWCLDLLLTHPHLWTVR